MLIKLVQVYIDSLITRSLAPILLKPSITYPQPATTIEDIWDGILNAACPKRKVNKRKVLTRRYGDENWKYGQKLFKPKRNIITCPDCGSFHEYHTICRNCFKKIHEESKKIIASIRSAWGSNAVDKEVKVLYKDEQSPPTEHLRIVELERPRPLWFTPNLSQKTASPGRTINGDPKVVANNIVIEQEKSG